MYISLVLIPHPKIPEFPSNDSGGQCKCSSWRAAEERWLKHAGTRGEFEESWVFHKIPSVSGDVLWDLCIYIYIYVYIYIYINGLCMYNREKL